MFDCSKVVPKICHGRCCIHVILQKSLWDKYKHLAFNKNYLELDIKGTHVLPITDDWRCPLNDPKTYRCAVYEDMPCNPNGKDFGTGKGNMYCPYLRPDGKIRPNKEMKEYLNDYEKSEKRGIAITKLLLEKQTSSSQEEIR